MRGTPTPQYLGVVGPERRMGAGARRPVSRVLSRAAARAMAIHLGRPLPGRLTRPTRAAGPETDPSAVLRPPHAAPTWSCSRRGLPCRSRRRARGALLPHPFTLARRPCGPGRAVCSLWHFPWGRPRRALPGSVLPWSPDFPPPRPEGGDGGHPAVWRLLTTPRRGPGQPRLRPAPRQRARACARGRRRCLHRARRRCAPGGNAAERRAPPPPWPRRSRRRA